MRAKQFWMYQFRYSLTRKLRNGFLYVLLLVFRWTLLLNWNKRVGNDFFVFYKFPLPSTLTALPLLRCLCLHENNLQQVEINSCIIVSVGNVTAHARKKAASRSTSANRKRGWKNSRQRIQPTHPNKDWLLQSFHNSDEKKVNTHIATHHNIQYHQGRNQGGAQAWEAPPSKFFAILGKMLGIVQNYCT